jgi:hypothetical protein
VNTVKQTAEFGLTQSGQHLVTPILFLSDIRGLGLAAAQGLTFVNGFYWDTNPETSAWSQRFFARAGVMPEMTQAGTYSGVMHYLKAVQAAGTKDGPTVAAKMRAMKVDDFFSHGGVIREDGRMVHDMYLMEVKTPAESTGPFDLLKQLSVLPGGSRRPRRDPLHAVADQAGEVTPASASGKLSGSSRSVGRYNLAGLEGKITCPLLSVAGEGEGPLMVGLGHSFFEKLTCPKTERLVHLDMSVAFPLDRDD